MAIIYGNKSVTDVAPSLDLRFSYRKDLVDTMSGKNLIDFSRSSSATYVDADGLIKTAASNEARFDHDPVTGESLGLLIEEARTNTFQYSNDFSNAYWSTYRTVAVNPNGGLAPDGTFTANYVASEGILGGRNRHIGGVAPGFVSVSVYIKSQTATSAVISCDIDGSAAWCYATYVFATNTATATMGSANSPTNYRNLSAQATSLQNGWVRFVFVFEKYGGSGTGVNIKFSLSGGSGWMWGSSQEAGGFPTSYIPTPATFTSRSSTATYYDASGIIQTAGIDVARDNAYFPDENGVFKPAGLLLEGSITNLLTYSEQFDNAAWTKTNATITVNAAIAPDGTTTAEKLASSTGTWTTFIHQTFGGSGTRTLSVFAKASDSSWIAMGGIGSADETAYFNLSTGTIGTKQANVTNAAIKKFPNGWYRCSVTCDFQSYGGFVPVSGDNTLSIAPIGQGIYIWGAQLEASPYATSYIPTTSSTVTRAADVSSSSTVTRSADVAQITGSNFSSWYNQSEGTIMFGSTPLSSTSNNGTNGSAIHISDGSSNNFVNVTNDPRSGGGGSGTVYVSGSPQFSSGLMGSGIKQRFVALAYQANNFAASAEGLNAVTDASGLLPVVNRIQIGVYPPTAPDFFANSRISRLTYYPQRLQDTTLQKLTR